MAQKMKAAIFVEPNRIVLDEKPVPDVGPLDALIRITTTTICGTDVHILKGEYPVARGLGTIAHPRTFGHGGVGSSYCWADPTSGVSFAFFANCRQTEVFHNQRMDVLSNLAHASIVTP